MRLKKHFSFLLSLLLLVTLCACSGAANEKLPDEATLEVHFLDVGQADSTLLVFGDEAMLIDGGNRADSSFIYSYLDSLGIDYLDYIVATHPHEDHIGGIMGAITRCDGGVFYSNAENSESSIYFKLKEKLDQKGIPRKIATPGLSFKLGEADVTFLGPVEYLNDYNDNSLCLRVDYGDCSFLFTGDAGEQAEKLLLQSGVNLEATVLSVGHHGSATSSCYEFLRSVNMDYAVISADSNASYSHPHESTLSKLYDAQSIIYRTDKNGNIIFKTDGKNVSVSCEKGEPWAKSEEESASEAKSCMYIGNLSSEKYHSADCSFLPSEKNRVYFATKEQAVSSGYSPCKSCKP